MKSYFYSGLLELHWCRNMNDGKTDNGKLWNKVECKEVV